MSWYHLQRFLFGYFDIEFKWRSVRIVDNTVYLFREIKLLKQATATSFHALSNSCNLNFVQEIILKTRQKKQTKLDLRCV